MILVYICPSCKSVRIASRRRSVECLECDSEMVLSDLTFMEWSEMAPEQRKAYGPTWYKKEMDRQNKWKAKQEKIKRNKKVRRK
jgi:hypothetical protein